MRLKPVFALTSLATLAACTTMDEPERRVTYSCERGQDITVVYAGDTARVTEGETEFVLQRQPTGSGFNYVSNTRTLRGKGAEVSYAVARMAPTTCRERRPEPR
jgi:hypothetical protein